MIKFKILDIDIRRATSELLSLQYLIFNLEEYLMYLQSLKDKDKIHMGSKITCMFLYKEKLQQVNIQPFNYI